MEGNTFYDIINTISAWLRDNLITIIVSAFIPLSLQLFQIRKNKAESKKLDKESEGVAVESAKKAIGVWETVVDEIKKQSDECIAENQILKKRVTDLTAEISTIQQQQNTLINTVQTIIKIFSEIRADTIALLDVDGNVEYVSLNVSELLGYDVSEFIHKNIYELFHADDRAQTALTLKQILLVPNMTIGYRARLRSRNNIYKWMEITGTNLNSHDKIKLHGVLISIRDISERKGIEEIFNKTYVKP